MSSHDRLRRRVARTGDESVPEAGRPAPDVAAILALQRSAGNRAVLQRLVYAPGGKALLAPASYAGQQVPWNDQTKRLEKREPRGTDLTLAALANGDADFRGHLGKGLAVDGLERVQSQADAALKARAAAYASDGAPAELKTKLEDVAVDPHRRLDHYGGVRYSDEKELDISWVMSTPSDFVPEASDLGGVGTSVRAPIPRGDPGQTYWEYACVLIALIKADGFGMVQTLANVQTNDLDAGVQALHDYYAGEHIDYDDSSTRGEVMKRWGFTPIYAGQSAWADLPANVRLNPGGKYIFDIPGHTFQVHVTREWPKDGKPLANPRTFLETLSEEDNYDKDETKLPVTYIWAK
jgi:hypothetical protein